MPKSRNEIRERNGKIVFWTILVMPLILFGIYSMIIISAFAKIEKPMKERREKRNKIEIQQQQNDIITSYFVKGY